MYPPASTRPRNECKYRGGVDHKVRLRYSSVMIPKRQAVDCLQTPGFVPSPFQLLLWHKASYCPRNDAKRVQSIIPAYLVSQGCLIKMKRRPVALAHVQRDVAGFEGLLHAKLAAAHQTCRYTPACVNDGCFCRVRSWMCSVNNGVGSS